MDWRLFLTKRWKIILPIMVVVGYLCVPVNIPSSATSTILYDQEENLLGASIADDGQWRFPLTDSIPNKIERSLLLYEDEYFYLHPGINPVSVLRAIYQNLEAGKVVSGASTLTMQLARMIRGQDRTIWQKLIETGMALRLEVQYSKAELLQYYASLAPFGGNVVGIDAASWRYYGRPAPQLSWAESASLAVLPNQPGAIYPGTGSEALKTKRNFLLRKLLKSGEIDSLEYQLSLEEPLPSKSHPVPQNAPHLMATLNVNHQGELISTTLDPFWQRKATAILERNHQMLKTNGVDNAAVIGIDLKTGKVLAYVGNTTDPTADGYRVDIIQSRRSSGSILKPMLYAKSLDHGVILPESMLPDVPTFFSGYTPKNFNLGYAGVVPADQALAMSLNIPFIHLLKDYQYERFHHDLKKIGISTLSEAPGHYGLSLILGGAEVKLWDLAQGYFSMYRKLANEFNYRISATGNPEKIEDAPFEEINLWHTFKAMTNLKRPDHDQSWQNFNSTQKIAWKTGTSFGFRDAWAVGLNGHVLIGVWVGNADGEGRAGLSGASSAGPILTELIRLSEYDPLWLEKLKPYAEIRSTCRKSGMLGSPNCPNTKPTEVGINAEKAGICAYHQQIWTDITGNYRVNRTCYDQVQEETIFVLPPTYGYYYQKSHSSYSGMLPNYPGCNFPTRNVLAINYPLPDAKIFIPRALQGHSSEVIIEASHQDPTTELFWHINDQYLGTTVGDHKQALQLEKGLYQIMLIDKDGNSASRRFEVVFGPKNS